MCETDTAWCMCHHDTNNNSWWWFSKYNNRNCNNFCMVDFYNGWCLGWCNWRSFCHLRKRSRSRIHVASFKAHVATVFETQKIREDTNQKTTKVILCNMQFGNTEDAIFIFYHLLFIPPTLLILWTKDISISSMHQFLIHWRNHSVSK